MGHVPTSREPTKVDLSAVEAEPAISSGAERDRGVRRPRRYITPGQDSRMSERFRTQPITSAERMESHRYRQEDFTIKVLCGGESPLWFFRNDGTNNLTIFQIQPIIQELTTCKVCNVLIDNNMEVDTYYAFGDV